MKKIIAVLCLFSANAFAGQHNCTLYNTFSTETYFSGVVRNDQVIALDDNNKVTLVQVDSINDFSPATPIKEYFFLVSIEASNPKDRVLMINGSNGASASGLGSVTLGEQDGITLDCQQ